jgi:hypothetical protein
MLIEKYEKYMYQKKQETIFGDIKETAKEFIYNISISAP